MEVSAATSVSTQHERQVARPLKVLVPLIEDDLRQGREAAERAGLPYYRNAGEKMLEAKPQVGHGSFQDWIKRNFGISKQQANLYMRLAGTEKSSALDFSSLSEFVRETGNPNYNKPHTVRPQAWHEPVKQAINTFNPEAYAKDLQNKRQERDLERKLALKLIDIGFKVLAAELHPDKRSGSSEAMTRLNNVRNRLKHHA